MGFSSQNQTATTTATVPTATAINVPTTRIVDRTTFRKLTQGFSTNPACYLQAPELGDESLALEGHPSVIAGAEDQKASPHISPGGIAERPLDPCIQVIPALLNTTSLPKDATGGKTPPPGSGNADTRAEDAI